MKQRRVVTRNDHERFCLTEGWTRRASARGRKGTDHVRYELALPNGEVLYTRISRPVDRTDYGASLWSHILRDQLQVTSAEFWSCVTDNVVPARSRPTPQTESIPLGLIRALTRDAGLTEAEVRAMSKADAVQRLVAFYTERE